MLPPQRLAILGYDDAGIGPRERYLLGPPFSHADGKHVAADPLGAAAAARAHVEASADAIVVHFDVDAVEFGRPAAGELPAPRRGADPGHGRDGAARAARQPGGHLPGADRRSEVGSTCSRVA